MRSPPPVKELVLDGVRIVFQLTPDAEAPAEMMFHFPHLRALCAAENCTSVMHNLYTLRGARGAGLPRGASTSTSPCACSATTRTWCSPATTGHASGREDVRHYLHQRHLPLPARSNDAPRQPGPRHDRDRRGLDLPASLAREFGNRRYYGTVNSHNAKAVYQRYLGWFDGSPANLTRCPPSRRRCATSRKYMGGADAVLEQARKDFDAGDYRWVAQVVNHVVFAEPGNAAAGLQAAALEQLRFRPNRDRGATST